MSQTSADQQGELTPAGALEVNAAGPAADAIAVHLPSLISDRVASRLFAKDATLWGPGAQEEAARRLGWTDLHETSRPLVAQVAALRERLQAEGVTRVVLCGMGGSSLAPEVICATAGVDLVVLDSSHPTMVADALADDLARTAVVVSSKSGSTVETDSQRRAFVAAFEQAGIDPASRLVVVTDPGSPLDEQSRAAGLTVINADPQVGGRYSALTAFGLVPSGLAGVDIEALLDEADEIADLLASDDEANPALRLGAAMAGDPARDKLVLVPAGTPVQGLGDWIEQLIAESTGKEGKGMLPVVVNGPSAPEVRSAAPDTTIAWLVGSPDDDALGEPGTTPGAAGPGSDDDSDLDDLSDPSSPSEIEVSGSLGGQMLLWEAATAVAGRVLGIDPFNQPDVESAKQAARDLMGGGATAGDEQGSVTDGDIVITALGGDWLDEAATTEEALQALLGQLDPQRGYLAVMAYLDRLGQPGLADVREPLAERTGRPVTFGWGPRFLHSTGQLHKGGPAEGVYLQITDEPADLPVPGQDFTFGEFIHAQAAGDAQVLADRGRPVLRLHLTTPQAYDRVRGLLEQGSPAL